MPYKARLKQGEPRRRKKPTYRVNNARAYNQSLRKRGMISLYVPDGDLKAQFINAKMPSSGQRCDRFAALELSVTQRCGQLARWLARGEAVSMIGQHRAEFRARQPVVRGKIRAEGHAHTVAKDAPGDRC
jgi:hypothetical protein